jgi:hypothetical protein
MAGLTKKGSCSFIMTTTNSGERCRHVLWACMGVLLGFAGPAIAEETARERMAKLNVVLPAAAEEALALQAAPEHLRSGATVYVFGKNGFEKTREGTNGFTCLVNRDGFFHDASNLKPTCWDAMGRTTYVPVMLKVGDLLARGESMAAIQSAIDKGFADGTFRAPQTGGIAYMLAGDVQVDPRTGEITRQMFPGHYMLYANGVTNEQLGFKSDVGAKVQTRPYVFSKGAGGSHGLAYLIIVAGESHEHDHVN